MSGLFLTADELEDLTGYKKAPKQIGWLLSKGFLYEVGGDARPKVLRAHLMARLGGTVTTETKEPQLRLP